MIALHPGNDAPALRAFIAGPLTDVPQLRQAGVMHLEDPEPRQRVRTELVAPGQITHDETQEPGVAHEQNTIALRKGVNYRAHTFHHGREGLCPVARVISVIGMPGHVNRPVLRLALRIIFSVRRRDDLDQPLVLLQRARQRRRSRLSGLSSPRKRARHDGRDPTIGDQSPEPARLLAPEGAKPIGIDIALAGLGIVKGLSMPGEKDALLVHPRPAYPADHLARLSPRECVTRGFLRFSERPAFLPLWRGAEDRRARADALAGIQARDERQLVGVVEALLAEAEVADDPAVELVPGRDH